MLSRAAGRRRPTHSRWRARRPIRQVRSLVAWRELAACCCKPGTRTVRRQARKCGRRDLTHRGGMSYLVGPFDLHRGTAPAQRRRGVHQAPAPECIGNAVCALEVRIATPRDFPTTGHGARSEEHTSELQSRSDLVCRLLLEKKKLSCAPFCTSAILACYCSKPQPTRCQLVR